MAQTRLGGEPFRRRRHLTSLGWRFGFGEAQWIHNSSNS
jgi:hypothetical protein